jgi:sugar phosphate isomerase/epimerase
MMASMSTRREFLRNSALAVGASTVGSHSLIAKAAGLGGQISESTGGNLVPFKLGMCSYTFREFDRAHVIQWMKELKLTGLNAKDVKDHLPMTPPEATLEAVAAYKAAGIVPHAVGTVYFPKNEDDDVRSRFEYAKRAGVTVIVAGDPTPETLPRIEKFVKEYDIRFALHNHGPEDKLWHSPLDVLKVVGNMDPRMGCCIDVGHTARAGVDPVEAIKAAGPRLFDVHIKDLADMKVKESQVAVGEGKMPVRQIFETLVAIKYKGFVDLEYEIHGDDPMPGATKSIEYMRGVLREMGYTG